MNTNNTPPFHISNPEEWLDELIYSYENVCIVIFRGHWCQYDEYYLRMLGQIHMEKMASENVVLVAWTSEGSKGAALADKKWQLTSKYGYDAVIGDQSLALAKYLKEDNILPALRFHNSAEHGSHVKKEFRANYPNGIVEPGLLFYTHYGFDIFKWASDKRSSRPLPSEMWNEVKKRKKILYNGNAVLPINGSKLHSCATKKEVLWSRLVHPAAH